MLPIDCQRPGSLRAFTLARAALASGVVAAGISAAAGGSSLVTLDVALAGAWQADCLTLGFDALVGTTNFSPGTVVPVASQLSDDFLSCAGVVFSSAGGPAAVVKVLGTSQAGDAQSLPNIIGGTQLIGGNVTISYVQPIHLEFTDASGAPSPVTKIGAWTDPTGSKIRLDVFDGSGAVVGTATADQGYFVGIEAAGIASATFTFLTPQSVIGFSLDDVSIRRGEGNPADLDHDGTVGAADLATLLGAWGTCESGCCIADLDNDGAIGAADLALLLGAWG